MSIAEEICARKAKLESDRATWNTLFEDIRTYIYPTTASFIPGTQNSSRGLDLNRKIYDPTAERAHKDLVGAIMSGMTNSATRWFNFSAVDERLLSLESNRTALEKATSQVLSVLANPKTNFYPAIHEGYFEITGLGTGVIFKRGKGSKSFYKCLPLGDVYFEENDYGLVDTVYRPVFMTPKQVMDQFPDINDANLKTRLISRYEGQPSSLLEVVHCVRPNKKYNSDVISSKPYESIYVLKDEGYYLLERKGYSRKPFYIARWETIAGRESLGRGLGMTAVKDAKVLNQMSKTNLEAGEVSVRPALQAPYGAFMQKLNLSPLAFNQFKNTIGLKDPRATPLVTVGNLVLGLEMENQRRRAIQESFFIDLLNEDKKQRMTQLETAQREQSRLGRMAPQMSRIQGEWLAPIVLDLYEELVEEGLIEAVSEDKKDLALVFNSPLTRAQKQAQSTSLQRFLNSIAAIGQIFPEVLEVPDPMELVDELRAIEEVPLRVVRDRDTVKKRLEQRAQQQQQEAQVAQMEQASKAGLNIAQIQKTGAELNAIFK